METEEEDEEEDEEGGGREGMIGSWETPVLVKLTDEL